jgi:6-pyruvoyltetrahydropterin/6-carboxytetrahydropterin synthase
MIITIHTEGWYDSAHHLNNYEGNCKNLHGHTYKIELWVKGEEKQLDKAGILFDFGILKQIIKKYDHIGDLTEIIGKNSTAENQAIMFYKQLKQINNQLLYKIKVYEQLEPKRSWAQIGDFE